MALQQLGVELRTSTSHLPLVTSDGSCTTCVVDAWQNRAVIYGFSIKIGWVTVCNKCESARSSTNLSYDALVACKSKQRCSTQI